jgi:hypothetical protein
MQQQSSLIVALSAMLMERKRAHACSRASILAFSGVPFRIVSACFLSDLPQNPATFRHRINNGITYKYPY